MKVEVTCPVFVKNKEHQDYLDLFTKSIVSRDHDIIFIPVENYIAPDFRPLAYQFNHQPEKIIIEYPQHEQSVAHAWNIGIEAAERFDCEYVLVTNTDIVLKSNAIDRLVAFAQNHQEAIMWTASEYIDLVDLEECEEDENYSEHPHFSCFMVKKDFFTNVGRFDENFIPAYCEDGDMHARIALANKKTYVYGGSKFYHFGSRTIKSDRELWDANTRSFPKNQQYFLRKWGHPVVNDVEQMRNAYFKTPYNEGGDLSHWESL